MDIKNYTSYFHDGSVTNIDQSNNKIIFYVESSEILPEWNLNEISLSKQQTIKGKLILKGINNILINEKSFTLIKML